MVSCRPCNLVLLTLFLATEGRFKRQRITYSFDASTTVNESADQNSWLDSTGEDRQLLNKLSTSGQCAVDLYASENNFIVGKIHWLKCAHTTADGQVSDCSDDQPIMFAMDSVKLNVQQLYITDVDEVGWTPLLAVSSLYFDLDGQIKDNHLDTVYGRCRRGVRENDSKDEIQRVYNCVPHANSSTFKHSSLVDVAEVDYTQFVTIMESDKTDIRSSETFTVGNSVAPGKSAAVVLTDARLAEQDTIDLPDAMTCMRGGSIADCLVEMKAKPIGASWPEIVHSRTSKLHRAAFKSRLRVDSSLQAAFHELTDPMGAGRLRMESGAAFVRLVMIAKQSTVADFDAVIKEPDNDNMLELLADVLASTGTQSSHKAAQTTLKRESVDLYRQYIDQLKYTPHAKLWMVQAMMKQLKTPNVAKNVADSLLLSSAALLNRLCVRDKCDEEANTLMSSLHSDIGARLESCAKDFDDTESCDVYFDALYNMASKQSLATAAEYLCTLHAQHVQQTALDILARVNVEWWSEQVFSSLLRLAYNRCPHNTKPATRHIAAQLLLNGRQRRPQLLNQILSLVKRNIKNDKPVDRELSAAIHSTAVFKSSTDRLFKDYANLQKRNRIYANDWNTLATGAMSTVYGTRISDELSMALDLNYAAGVFRSFSVLLGGEHMVHLYVDGLDTWLSTESDNQSDNTKGGMQLSFFGFRHPRNVFFDSQSTLMTALWGLDGSDMHGFKGSMLIDEQRRVLPLVSGGSLILHTATGVALDMVANVELSLWNRDAQTNTKLHGATGTQIDVAVVTRGVQKPMQMRSTISTFGGLQVKTDTRFADEPYIMCVRTATSGVQAQRTVEMAISNISKHGKPRTKVYKNTRSTSFNDVTFANNAKASQMCRDLNV